MDGQAKIKFDVGDLLTQAVEIRENGRRGITMTSTNYLPSYFLVSSPSSSQKTVTPDYE